jgi:hypothetical protein
VTITVDAAGRSSRSAWLPAPKREIMLIVVIETRALFDSRSRRTVTARQLGIFFVGMCLFNATTIATAIGLIKLGARGWELWPPLLAVMIAVVVGYGVWIARRARSTT